MKPSLFLHVTQCFKARRATGKAGRLMLAISAIGTVSGLAASITWNGSGADNNWSSVANWSGSTAVSGDALVFSGVTRLTNVNDGLTSIGTVDFNAGDFNISGNALILNGNFTSAGSNTWAINSTLGAARSFTSNSGTLTLSGSITNANFLTTIAGAGNTSISGILGGSGGLAKTGTGTLTLSNANTYTGTTTISPGGTLAISQDANLGSVPGIATAGSLVIDGNSIDGNGVLATTATFTLNAKRGIKIGPSSGIGAGTIDVASGTVLSYGGIITSSGSGTGGLTKAGAGTLVLSGANTYTGTTSINAGILQVAANSAIPFGTGKGNVVVNATLDLNGNSSTVNGLSGTTGLITSGVTGAITFTAGANNQGGIYNGVIQNGSGTLAFTKAGTGSITLGGTNTFTGGVTINGGALQLGSVSGLGAATNGVTFGPAAAVGTKLQLNGNSITMSSLATNATPGSVILENANVTAATLTVNQSATTTFAGVIQNGAGGGALSLVKTGSGILALAGTNTYTGNTTITGGTLQMGSAQSTPSGSGSGNFVLDGNASAASVGILDINGFDVSINGLSGITGAFVGKVVNNRVATTKTITVGSGDATTTFAGLIADNTGSGGTLNLSKTGSGTLTLSKANTYGGSTGIRNGTLILGIANALPTATIVTLGDGTTNASGVLKLNGFTQSLAGLTTIGTGLANRVVNDSATAVSLTLNTSINSSFSGILGGSTANENNFSLIKTGSATMTLSGVNTFTGTTTISQGILSVGNLATALGSAASAVILGDASNVGTLSFTGTNTSFTRGLTISAGGGGIDATTSGQTLTLSTGGVAAGGAFTVGGAGNLAISSNITGIGSLNKTGLGTLTLSGSNTYSGATNIKNGTILLAVNDTGLKSSTTLTLGDGTANTNGVLKLNAFTQTLAGLLTIGTGTGNRVVGGNAALSTLTLNIATTDTFAGIFGGPGSNENNLALSKIGAGTLTLSGTNTFTGGTAISAGTLAISADNNLGAGSLTIGAATLQITSTFSSARSFSFTDPLSTVLLASGVTYTHSGSISGSGTFKFTGFSSSVSNLVISGTSKAYTGVTQIRTGNLMLGAANVLPTTTSVTLYGGGKLSLNGYSQTLAALTVAGGGTNSVVNGKSTAVTLTINNDIDSTFAGILGGAGANENNFALTKTGAAILTLSGANLYAGDTTISSGTLKAGIATALPSGVGKGDLFVAGTGILDLNNFGITVNGLFGTGTVTNSAANAITFTAGSNDKSSSFGGVIQDGGGTVAFTKIGTGTLTLTNANTYSGITTIATGGTLKIGNLGAIPVPTGTVKGNVSLAGTLDLFGYSITIASLTGAGGISSSIAGGATISVGANDQSSVYTGIISNNLGTVSLTKVGSGILTISGASTFSGDTTISAGTLKLNGTAAIPSGAGRGNLVIASGATLDMNNRSQTINGLTGLGAITSSVVGAITLTAGTIVQNSSFDGVIQNGAGTIALTKTSTGTLTLTGANTFTGLTTISAGTLALSNGSALADNDGVSLAASATLLLNASEMIGSLTGAGGTVNLQSYTLSVGGDNTSPATYAGAISGSGSLTKIGTGTLTLSGTSGYTGITTISSGTLSIRADLNLGGVPATATPGSLVISGDGILQITTNNFTLSSNRGIALGSGASGNEFGTVDVASLMTLTYGGIIANNVAGGTGGLSKISSGILVISGTANSYSGGTAISGGLLNVTGTTGTPLGSGNVSVSAGGNLSLSSANNINSVGGQTITVTSTSGALGGIGFSSTSLTQGALAGMFTDSTSSFGGVLSINNGISYATALNLATFGNGSWYLGSASSGTYSAASLTVGNDNIFRLGGGGGTLTVSLGVLGGTSSLVVGSSSINGQGRVILSANQAYSGTTTINGGTLSVAADLRLGTGTGVGNIVINGGALSASAGFTLNSLRGIALGASSGSASGTLDVASGTLNYAGIIANNGSGSGSLIKTGVGTLALSSKANSYSGSTTINGGTLSFTDISDLGIGTDINFNGGTLLWAATNMADISARNLTVTAAGGGTFNTNNNNVTLSGNAITGSGALTLTTGTGTLTLGVANSYTGATTISAASTVKLGNAAAIPSGPGRGATTLTGTLDLNNFSPTLNLLGGVGTVTNTATGVATLTVDTANSSSGSSFSGALNNGSGTTSLLKVGANSFTLSGITNTYSGGSTINLGTLLVSDNRALGAIPETATAGSITIASGAVFGSVTNDVTISSNRGIAINGATAASINVAAGKTLTYGGVIANTGATVGGLTKVSSTGILYLTGVNTCAGDTTVSGGVLKVGNSAAIPSGVGKGNVSVASANSGAIDLNGFSITVNGLSGAGTIRSNVAGNATITIGDNNQTSAFTGVILNGNASAVVGVTKIGSGTLTLSGSNSYTGVTTISNGIISIGADTHLGGIPATPTGGSIVINGGMLTFSATMTLSTNRGIAVGPASGSGTGTLEVATGKTVTYSGIIADNGGTGALTKTATTGVLVLGGSNTYSGNTTIAGGTLQLGNAAAIPSGSGKGNFILTTGTLDLYNFSTTVNGLSGAGIITNSNSLPSAVTFTAGGNNATSSFSGIMQDGNGSYSNGTSLSFTKIGSGTLTLSGANTYSGDTTVSSGILEVANSSALPSGILKGNVIVNGTLDLDAPVTINGLSGSGIVSTDTALALTLTAGGNDQSSTFAGNLINGSGGGSLALTKTGTGTLTLEGNNTYSGATSITSGTLAMGRSSGISSNSSVNIATAGTLDVHGYNVSIDGLTGTGRILNNGSSDVTLTSGASGASTQFDGVIADGTNAIALVKSGTGTLTLAGANTYSGTTTISNGTLSVANPGLGGNLGTATSAIILGDAATKGTLSFTTSSDVSYTRGFTVNAGGGQINISGGKTLTLQTGEITTTGTFSVGGAGNAIINSVISGSGGFAKANGGSMLVNSANTYAGDTTISSGALQLGNIAALPSGSGKGNLIVNGSLDVNNLNITVNGLSGAGTITNTTGAPVMLTVGDDNAAGNFTGVVQDGNGTSALTKIGGGVLQLGGANTYSGNTTISAGTLQIDNAAAIPSGAYKGNVVVNGALDLRAISITVNGLSGAGTVSNSGGSAAVISAGAYDQTSTFGGNIVDGASATGLTKTGTGILTLSGVSTFSGATTVSQGTLSMGSTTGLSSHSTLTIDNAGALDLNGQVITIDGLAGSGSITNNSATPVSLTTGASGGSGIFAGTINDGSGVIALVKTGTGTVTLSNINSYSGGTTVTGGLLGITSYGALGSLPLAPAVGNIVLNGGGISATNTFEINAKRGIAVGPAVGSGSGSLDAALNQTLSYNGIIANNGSGSGGLGKTGLGTVTLGGVNTYTGDTTISAGAVQIGNALAIPSGSGKGNLTLNATLDLNNTSITVNGLTGTGLVSNTKTGAATLSAGANDQTSTFGGVIENGNGTVALAKVGSGTLTLTGSNSHTGGTTVAAGTLVVSADHNLGAIPNTITPANIAINAGATLSVTSSFTLDARRGIAVGPAGAGIIEVAPGQTLGYGGAIANNGGSGGLSKTGGGTLVLSGISSYTGATTVAAGVLTVNGSAALSTSGEVRSGATLTGTGTTGAMTIDSAGTIAPGNSGIGQLGVAGGLVLSGNAEIELGTPGINHANPGTSDRVNVTGGIALGGNLNLIDNAGANGQGSLGAGSYKIFTYTEAATGSFAAVNGLPTHHWALHDVVEDKAIYIDLYNYAVATVTPEVDLGRIHAGGTFGTQALTVGNTTAAGNYTESLAGVFGTPAAGITAAGSVSGIAGQASNTSNLVVGISDNTAGQKNGLVDVHFTSQAVSTSGLSDTTLASQSVAVTGFAYTGQSVWNIAGGGSWGNNGNAFGNWTHEGGVAGLDGLLSAADTATFGNATSAPTTVSLDGANPTVSGIKFDHSQAYTLAQGSGGTLTLKGNGGAASVSDETGSHNITVGLTLATDANVAVTHAADTLTVAGAISGSGKGVTKTGEGTLALTGHSGYTGATVVSAGTLLVSGSLGNTATTIASGGTLAGSGTLAGGVTVNGNLAPGELDSIGMIGVDSLYLAHTLLIEWNGTADTIDQVNITHELQLGEFSTIVFTGREGMLTQPAYVFASYGSRSGPVSHFDTITNLPGGYAIDYSYGASNNQLALVAVPEPRALLLGGIGLMLLLKRRRVVAGWVQPSCWSVCAPPCGSGRG